MSTEVTLKPWLVPVPESAFQVSWEVVHKDSNLAHVALSRAKCTTEQVGRTKWEGEHQCAQPLFGHCVHRAINFQGIGTF